ncbi:MAG: hypothetical protein SGJ27_14450 [Candidatus Melainabacteria bacterium]|mgnify:CR=1 FL=1|nr:hypothetical protein [Candidatus Melainabacteria bacterium]
MCRKNLLPIFLIAALLSATAADCKPKNLRTLQLLALKEMQATVISAQKSDDIMLKEIDTVANQLQRVLHSRVRTRGSEPLYMRKGEVESLQHHLARTIGANPYAGNPYLKGDSANDTAGTAQNIATRLSNANGQSVYAAGNSNDATSALDNSNPASSLAHQPSALQNINIFEKKPERHHNACRVMLVSVPDASWYDAAVLRKEIPEDWRAEPGTIQIIHNGQDTCFIWGAGIEGRPVYDRDKQRFKVIAMRVGQH